MAEEDWNQLPPQYDSYWQGGQELDKWIQGNVAQQYLDSVPEYLQENGGSLLIPVNPSTPEAAAARYSGEIRADDFWSAANIFTKKASTMLFIAADFPVEVARTIMLGSMKGIDGLINQPSWTAAGKVFAPWLNVAPAVADTHLNAFINVAQEKGLSYAFSDAGIGEGYFLDPESQVAMEKEALAAAFWTLPNDDPATWGRWIATMIGLEKESTAYGTLSGTVDAISYLADPLNLIPGFSGVKSGRAVARTGKGLDVVSAGELDAAGQLIEQAPGALAGASPPSPGSANALGATGDIRRDFDYAERTRRVVMTQINGDPELVAAVDDAIGTARETLARADLNGQQQLTAAAGYIDREGRPIKDVMEYFQLRAETVGQASRRAQERIDQLANDIKAMETSSREYTHQAHVADQEYRRLFLRITGHDLDALNDELANGTIDLAEYNRIRALADADPDVQLAEAQTRGRLADAEDLELRTEGAQKERDQLRSAINVLSRAKADQAVDDVQRSRLVQQIGVELANQGTLDAALMASVQDYAKAQQILVGKVSTVTRKIPDLPAGTVQDGMRALFGIHDNGADLTAAFRAITRGKGDALAEVIAAINREAVLRARSTPDDLVFGSANIGDPSALVKLRDLLPGVDVPTLQRLTTAQRPEEVLALLLDGWTKGDLELNQKLVNKWIPSLGKSATSTSSLDRFEQRLISVSRRSAPDKSKVDFEDVTSVVNFWDNWISSSTDWMMIRRWTAEGDDLIDAESIWRWRNAIMDKIAGAETWTARKAALIQGQMDFIDEALSRAGLEGEQLQAMRARLGQISDDAQDYEKRLSHVVATIEATDNPTRFSRLVGSLHDPTELAPSNRNLIIDADQVSKGVSSPNPRAMRKLMRLVREQQALKSESKGAVGKELATVRRRLADVGVAINDGYDAVFRPLYLAFRPGYVVLQFADGAFRAHFTGGTNLLTNPVQAARIGAGLMVGKRPWTQAFLERFAADVPKNADGTPMWPSEYVASLEAAVQSDNARMLVQYLRTGHFRDFLNLDNPASRKIKQGFKWFERNSKEYQGRPTPGYDRAWGNEYLVHMRVGEDDDLLFRAVADLELTGQLPKYIDDWAKANTDQLPQQASREDAILEYFHNGPGKQQLVEVAQSAWERDGVPSRAGSIFTDKELLRAYLFDKTEPASKATRVQLVTGGDSLAYKVISQIGSELAERERNAATLGPKWVKKQQKQGLDTRRYDLSGYQFEIDLGDPDGVADQIAALLRHRGNDGPPTVIGPQEYFSPPIDGTPGMGERAGELATLSYTWFFNNAANAEKFFTHAPWMRDELWLQQSRRVALLDPQDAAEVAARIREQMPARKTKKQKEALKQLDEGVKRAHGIGEYTPEDLVDASYAAGLKTLGETFYGIKGRNAAAQRIAIMWPFWQAAANAYKVYARSTARNPKYMLNATRLWQNAQTEESGVLYELPGMPPAPDPSYGFVYQDGFGNQKLRIPLLGYFRSAMDVVASGLTGNGVPEIVHPSYLEVRTNIWNPINFGEPLPGVGPGISLPVNGLNAALNDRLPLWLSRYVEPYQTTDLMEQRSFMEKFLPAHVAMLLADGAQKQKWMGSAASYLIAANPGRYGSGGFITEDGKNLLMQDAADAAWPLMIGQVAANFMFRGGTTRPQDLQVGDGGLVAAAVLYEEFDAIREETSAGQAYAEILDKYGPSGLAFLVGKRDFDAALTGDAGYRAAQSNPKAFRQSPAYFGYFYPTSEWRYNSPEYRRMVSEMGFNEAKGVDGYVEDINWVLYNTARLNLESKRASDEISQTQFEAGNDYLRQQYDVVPQNEFNTKRVQQRHGQLRTLMTFPDLSGTKVGGALRIFYDYYDAMLENIQGNTFSGKSDARARRAMRELGDELARIEPEFAPLWTFELRGEFLDEGAN